MHGPAPAAVGDEIGLAWTGTDRRLNLLITPDRRLGALSVSDQTSSWGPALCTIDGQWVLGWTGTDHRPNIAAAATKAAASTRTPTCTPSSSAGSTTQGIPDHRLCDVSARRFPSRVGFEEIGWRDYACSSIGRRPPQIVG